MKGVAVIKRIVSLLFVICLFVGLFSGCGGAETVGDDIFSRDNVTFLKDGKSVYNIIRPSDGADLLSVAGTVYHALSEGLNAELSNRLDTTNDGVDRYEILIGDTNRPESALAKQYLLDNGYRKYNDFIICTIGKKIVINAFNLEATERAVEYFCQSIFKPEGVEGGILYINQTEGEFDKIAVNGVYIEKFRLICDATNRSWLIDEEVRKLQDFISQSTGFYLPIENDTEVEHGEYEISIGATDRVLSASLKEYGYDDYEIKILGSKVYILGGSTYSIQTAVTEFLSLLRKGSVNDADSKRGSYKETIKTYDLSTYYRYIWGDEFDGVRLDATKWSIIGFFDGKAHAVQNDETFDVKDGNIIMRAVKTGSEQYPYMHCDAIKSSNTMKFNKGYLELRAMIPDGYGVYSSFWLNGGGLEIDIFESLGAAHKLTANIHYWRSDENGGHISLDGGIRPTGDRTYVLSNGSFSDSFHTVGFLWTDTEVKFFFDGEQYYRHPTNDYFVGKYLQIITGFNVGWAGRRIPDDSLFPLEFVIDSIRLYQIEGDSVKYG